MDISNMPSFNKLYNELNQATEKINITREKLYKNITDYLNDTISTDVNLKFKFKVAPNQFPDDLLTADKLCSFTIWLINDCDDIADVEYIEDNWFISLDVTPCYKNVLHLVLNKKLFDKDGWFYGNIVPVDIQSTFIIKILDIVKEIHLKRSDIISNIMDICSGFEKEYSEYIKLKNNIGDLKTNIKKVLSNHYTNIVSNLCVATYEKQRALKLSVNHLTYGLGACDLKESNAKIYRIDSGIWMADDVPSLVCSIVDNHNKVYVGI